MTIKERLQAIRLEMTKRGINLYIVPSSDPHKSEYVAERFRSRTYLSGFTGSAGLLLVTLTDCHLWTDGRYFIQAARELEGSGIVLEKMNEPGVKTYIEFIQDYVTDGSTIGYDSHLFSIDEIRALKEAIQKDVSYEGSYDLLDYVWQDRPSLPYTDAYVHEITYTGQSVQDKLTLVREKMSKEGADFYVISALNDLCWLFNIRANDVDYTPVIYCYGLISQSDAMLYVNGRQITPAVNKHLSQEQVIQRDYPKISADLMHIPDGQTIVLDPSVTSEYIINLIPEGCKVIEKPELTGHIKAKMHPVEIQNLRQCQVDDGVAMVRFLHWMDQTIQKETLTEIQASDKLTAFRAEIPSFIEPSFKTIPAYQANGAMMHYATDEMNSPTLEPSGFFLIDSGGQYHNGTTDITRTLVLGPLSDEAKTDFTLVLKAHIALASFVFLEGTTGVEMDAIARQPIWQARMDYKCGTGHGVGYLLGVHEGIQRIARAAKPVALEPGMIITNEPGIYREGSYGIRTENTLLVTKDVENDFGHFLHFETISYCPIDRRAIVKDMLTPEELSWLNTYHETVYDHLSPGLDEAAKSWLYDMTRPL